MAGSLHQAGSNKARESTALLRCNTIVVELRPADSCMSAPRNFT
jgi:hypothetical protein